MAKRPRSPKAEAFQRLADWFRSRSGAEDDERDLRRAMDGEPEVTPLLRRFAKGGLPVVIPALRAYDDEDAAALVALYDSRTRLDQRHLSLEALAVACGIGCVRLRELALSALAAYNQDAVRLIITTSMPGIVATSAKMALTPRNVDDRMAMLKAATVLPVPKGSQIQINATAPQLTVGDGDLPTADPALTTWDAERQLRALHEAWGEKPKQLPAAGAPHGPLPAAVERIQQDAAEAQRD